MACQPIRSLLSTVNQTFTQLISDLFNKSILIIFSQYYLNNLVFEELNSSVAPTDH